MDTYNFYIFPFEYVPKGSNVFLYGLGDVGKNYLNQIELTNWCHVIGVSDRDELKAPENYKFYSIDAIEPLEEADIYIISIKSLSIALSVKYKFILAGIEEKKILHKGILELSSSQSAIKHNTKNDLSFTPGKVYIALQLMGGLGDYVVYLHFYEELIHYLPDARIIIYANPKYAKCLFSDRTNVERIIKPDYFKLHSDFDIVIQIEHVIKIIKYETQKIKAVSPDLDYKIQKLMAECCNNHVDISSQIYRDAIVIRKFILQKKNRYTALENNGIFNLCGKKITIGLDESFYPIFQQLELKKYITFNYGADDIFHDGRIQTKVWPLEYYHRLSGLIKKEFPDITLIQVGGANACKIPGMNKYFIGYDLEFIKYVLKFALFHFDCEGGLVHLATHLGTKCIVTFGPTPVSYYGYEQNINILSDKCRDCIGLTPDWYVHCVRNLEKPECMYSLTPDLVMERIRDYINSLPY